MGKKLLLIGISLSPILLGYLYNLTLSIGMATTFFLYLFPILMLVLWFWAGTLFTKEVGKYPLSLLLAHFPGLLSLLVFLWQFWWTTDALRSQILADISQMYVASTGFYTILFALLFEQEAGTVTRSSSTAMQCLGLLFMVAVFSLGYSWEKKRIAEGL